MNQAAPTANAQVAGTPPTGTVELVMPASSAYLALVRATTNSTCARLDFTIERLDDVTLAVDEAVSLLIGDAVPGTPVRCRWIPTASGVKITITTVSSAQRAPRTTTFAWTVLAALVDEASAEYTDPEVVLTLSASRDWAGNGAGA